MNMRQRFLRALVIAGLDQRLVCLARAGLGGDVGAQVTHYVAALVDIRGGPGAALAVQEVRPHPLQLEQRRVIHGGLVKLAGVLRDQLADHLQMAEFLDRDILQHVADARVLDMEGLHPILKRGRQLAGGSAELFQQELAKARIRGADIHRPNQLFAMKEHVITPLGW
jgi:hypothetical protein